MTPSNAGSNSSFTETLSRLKPNLAFVVMILGALIAFEVFNYSTTDHALRDLLGDLAFAGIHWSTILALAFCGIDFAGIARLFTPEQGSEEPKEVWYLFGAWLMAATMNAILTWWGVSMAVANHTIQSSTVMDPNTISGIVPVFVAIMVWVIRILIIAALSLSIERLFHPGQEPRTALQSALEAANVRPRTPVQPTQPMRIPTGMTTSAIPPRPSLARSASASSRYNRASTPAAPPVEEEEYMSDAPVRSRAEPTYHSLSMSARPSVRSNGGKSGGSGSGDGAAANRFRRS
jgi:hypothetical protein